MPDSVGNSAAANIASHLPEMARRQPDTLSVALPDGVDNAGDAKYRELTFAQLESESNTIAAGLEAVGIGRGVRTVLMVKPGLDFFALTFALFKVGAVPVFVDPGMGVRNLGKCLAEAEPTAFIGITKAHVARSLLRWARPSLTTLVTVGRKLWWGGITLDDVRAAAKGSTDYTIAPTDAADIAAILFTSGSTGVPKGVVYTHGIFTAQVDALKTEYHIQPGEIDLPTFPLFALFAPALGMSSIIPDMDFTRPGSVDPQKIIGPINRFGCTTMFGSPALLDRVSRYGAPEGVKLPTLRRVISAGAPVPSAVLERMHVLLPTGAEIFTPYGATESLPVCSIGSGEILADTAAATGQGKGVCVGRPVGDMAIEVIKVSDEPIERWSDGLRAPEGEIGEIVVKGPVVTRQYFGREASTKLAKIQDDGGAVRHRMGDLGYRDEKGRLWFCGRKSHRVETQEGVFFTVPCEGVFNTHPNVRRTALVGIGPKGKQIPVLCVELDRSKPRRSRLKVIAELRELASKFDHTKGIHHILFRGSFPVDIRHNAKIGREKLANWAELAIKEQRRDV